MWRMILKWEHPSTLAVQQMGNVASRTKKIEGRSEHGNDQALYPATPLGNRIIRTSNFTIIMTMDRKVSLSRKSILAKA